MNKCPVCYFADMEMSAPPEPYYICPCCGTEFGLDDETKSFDQLRREWIERGMLWFSRYTPPPEGWSALRQLGVKSIKNVATSRATTAAVVTLKLLSPHSYTLVR